MIVYRAPETPIYEDKDSVFLAGTIDNGTSVNWQQDFEAGLEDLDVVVLNPRREKWEPSELQTIENPKFKEQVEWELTGLENCSIIVMCFLANSKSPITLLELGLNASSGKLVVCCEKGFWRKGNVDVVCNKYKIPIYENISSTLTHVRNNLMHPRK